MGWVNLFIIMCALPSAQLGSMPSLNVPSYIPTTVIQKEPKAWEKALLAILTQAGSAAANQGVQNAMTQDYASEFGKTPTTGFSKLLSGPTIDTRQAMQMRGENAANERLGATITSHRQENEFDRIARNISNMDNARLAAAQLGETTQHNIAQNLLGTSQLGETTLHNTSTEDLTKSAQDEAAIRARMLDERERPARDAYTREQTARAEGEKYRTDIARQTMEDLQRKTKGGIDPTLAKDYSPLSPRQQSVQDRLRDTTKYPTGQQILDRGQANPAPYQGMGTQYSTPPPPELSPSPTGPQASLPLSPSSLPPEIEAIQRQMRFSPSGSLRPEQLAALQEYLRTHLSGGYPEQSSTDPAVILNKLLSQYQSVR